MFILFRLMYVRIGAVSKFSAVSFCGVREYKDHSRTHNQDDFLLRGRGTLD